MPLRCALRRQLDSNQKAYTQHALVSRFPGRGSPWVKCKTMMRRGLIFSPGFSQL